MSTKMLERETKVAIIGAGGYTFPLRLIGDILSFEALKNVRLCLMDIDQKRVDRVGSAADQVIKHHGLAAQVETTTDRRQALSGADFVIIAFQVGGNQSYAIDIEIPRSFGIDQPVGDTLGPGGVFRFLRSASEYELIAADVRELCPSALVLNYANPMAMATWYLSDLGVNTVGLCHSVQGTTRMLARALEVPYEEVNYLSAGINHQAWILNFRRGEEDLYPQLRSVMERKHQVGKARNDALPDDGQHSTEATAESVYEGGNEQVRTTLMNYFGYFETESSHHASEYVPYFRKDADTTKQYIPERWDYLELCQSHDASDNIESQVRDLQNELKASVEYGAEIINAITTNTPTVVYGNVPNNGMLISNLPANACVEVPCLVDAQGVQPTAIGDIPPQLAALNHTNINVQQLAVLAAKARSRDLALQAVAVDPLTASKLTLDQISNMVDQMFVAHAEFLKQFNK